MSTINTSINGDLLPTSPCPSAPPSLPPNEEAVIPSTATSSASSEGIDKYQGHINILDKIGNKYRDKLMENFIRSD